MLGFLISICVGKFIYVYIGRGSGEFVVRKVEGNLECLRGSLSFGLSLSYNSGFLSCS